MNYLSEYGFICIFVMVYVICFLLGKCLQYKIQYNEEKQMRYDLQKIIDLHFIEKRRKFYDEEVELIKYQKVARRYMCKTPEELLALVDDIQVRTMNEVVKDFTTWNDCDVNTENPGEKYYKCNYGWVLVKMQNRVDNKEYDIPAVAKFNKSSHLWAFSIIAEREMVRDLKVVKWRPIH